MLPTYWHLSIYNLGPASHLLYVLLITLWQDSNKSLKCINAIYARTLWSFYGARLDENELHKLYRKVQLYLTCLTPPARKAAQGAPQCLTKREEKAISNTEMKQSS